MTCTLDSRRCVRTEDVYETDLEPCCRDKIVETVDRVGRLLDKHKIAWWIDYGTLLGYARHGDMIPWDKDADLGVFEDDVQKIIDLKPNFVKRGHKFCYHQPGEKKFHSGHWINVWRSKMNQNGLDIFPWYQNGDGLYHRKRYAACDRFKGREFPPDRLLPLQKVEWAGIKVWAPADVEWFVAHRYGPYWQMPLRKNHDGVRK